MWLSLLLRFGPYSICCDNVHFSYLYFPTQKHSYTVMKQCWNKRKLGRKAEFFWAFNWELIKNYLL
jgi:hypothetical protein